MTRLTRLPVRSQPPPVWLLRLIVNPVVPALTGTPVGGRMGRLSLLRFLGRRTGRTYAVPVLIHQIDGRETVFTDARWAANFRDGHAVTVVGRGMERSTTAELVEDPRIVGPALRTALDKDGHPRRLGLAIEPGHSPTDSEFGAVRSMILIQTD